jgi:OmpA-OmpF porin, OOP family
MSLLTDLSNTLDRRTLDSVASALGESGQSISRGMQSAIAAVLGGMAKKSNNPSFLKKVLDLAPSGPGGVTWSTLSSSVSDPNSPLMASGRNILSTLFGGSGGPVTRALGAGTGLQTGAVSSLMAMAAPMVMSFLGRKAQDEKLSMGGLGNLLQRELPAIRAALPAGVTDLLWPREHETVTTPPLMAQTEARERSAWGWLPALLLLALVPVLFWLFSHGRRQIVQIPPAPTGTANRTVPEVSKPSLAKNVDLYFQTGSMKLRPESEAQLREFAAAFDANRDARILVNGYTDNVGNAASNMRLSQERANAVKNDLIRMGIPESRLSTQGFGGQNPIADNATPEGRRMNSRVSVQIGNR